MVLFEWARQLSLLGAYTPLSSFVMWAHTLSIGPADYDGLFIRTDIGLLWVSEFRLFPSKVHRIRCV